MEVLSFKGFGRGGDRLPWILFIDDFIWFDVLQVVGFFYLLRP